MDKLLTIIKLNYKHLQHQKQQQQQKQQQNVSWQQNNKHNKHFIHNYNNGIGYYYKPIANPSTLGWLWPLKLTEASWQSYPPNPVVNKPIYLLFYQHVFPPVYPFLFPYYYYPNFQRPVYPTVYPPTDSKSTRKTTPLPTIMMLSYNFYTSSASTTTKASTATASSTVTITLLSSTLVSLTSSIPSEVTSTNNFSTTELATTID